MSLTKNKCKIYFRINSTIRKRYFCHKKNHQTTSEKHEVRYNRINIPSFVSRAENVEKKDIERGEWRIKTGRKYVKGKCRKGNVETKKIIQTENVEKRYKYIVLETSFKSLDLFLSHIFLLDYLSFRHFPFRCFLPSFFPHFFLSMFSSKTSITIRNLFQTIEELT